MVERFYTVYGKGETELIEKRSKFLSTVLSIKSEEEAQKILEAIRKEHYNAVHNVFAYQVGYRNEIKRYSDDGEPSGTGGVPILGILVNEDLKNTLVVVTRYFGGTLLGTGGLVKAYSQTAKDGIKQARIIEKILNQKLSIVTDYELSGKLQYEILEFGGEIINTIYTESVEYIVLIENSKLQKFLSLIQEITSATIKPVFKEQLYVAYVDEQLKMYEI